jgi:hypothetical protein
MRQKPPILNCNNSINSNIDLPPLVVQICDFTSALQRPLFTQADA